MVLASTTRVSHAHRRRTATPEAVPRKALLTWREVAATLSPAAQARLGSALGGGLQEVRIATQLVAHDGGVHAVLAHLDAAVRRLQEVRPLLLGG